MPMHAPSPRRASATGRIVRALRALVGVAVLALLIFLAGPLLLSPAAAPQADAACLIPPSALGAGPPPEIWVAEARGIVDPALASFLVKTMGDAAAAGAGALVVQLDTPGGLDSAMRDIVQAELDCPIPVVFYVSPQGARAASAGLYILMGADVAAMAPSTNLGAATPVSLGQEMDETMQAKVTNDAAAYIRGLATARGRNADWAEKAVREAVSLPAEEALQQGVIEFVAPDVPSLLQALDGHFTTPKGLVIWTTGAPIKEVKMGWIQRFLHAIASPDIAYVLLTLGVLGIILEFTTPGLGLAGITGVISLFLAFYAFQILPVSLVGIALVVVAFILFVAEIKVQSSGILGIGGTAALILGGLLLFNTSEAYLRVSWPVLVVVAVIVFAFFAFVIRAVTRAMHRPSVSGMDGLMGATGVTLTPLTPEGKVKVAGETWRARVEGTHLLRDEQIEVHRYEGLTLIVRRPDETGRPSQQEHARRWKPQRVPRRTKEKRWIQGR